MKATFEAETPKATKPENGPHSSTTEMKWTITNQGDDYVATREGSSGGTLVIVSRNLASLAKVISAVNDDAGKQRNGHG